MGVTLKLAFGWAYEMSILTIIVDYILKSKGGYELNPFIAWEWFNPLLPLVPTGLAFFFGYLIWARLIKKTPSMESKTLILPVVFAIVFIHDAYLLTL